MKGPGKVSTARPRHAVADAAVAAAIAFLLFSLTLGVRLTDTAFGLVLTPRPYLLFTAVGIVFAGRLLLNLFWWNESPQKAALVAGLRRFFQSLLLVRWLRSAFPEGSDPLRILGLALIGFAALFPIVAYALNKAFGLGLPLRYIFDLSILVLTYVMLGWGLNIVVGLAGLLDLGYVAFYAVGAYTFALLGTTFGWSFWMCLPLAGVLAAFWGILLGFPVLRLRGDYLAIVTLAFGEIIRVVLLNWVTLTNGPNGISDIPKPSFFGLPFGAGEGTTFSNFFGITYDPLHAIIFLYYIILGLALLTNFVTLRLRRLPIGRAWEAMRENEIACRSLGINTLTTKLSAFATGALFGGFSGSFFATRQGFISPESFTFLESATILAIVVLGGMGSQLGVAIAAGVLIIGLEILRNTEWLQLIFGRDFDPALYRMMFFGGAMVIIMIWRPRGLIATRAPTVVLHEKRAIAGALVSEGRG